MLQGQTTISVPTCKYLYKILLLLSFDRAYYAFVLIILLSCGVNEQPLYFGLILPLAIIFVIHFILSVLNLSKINQYHLSNSTDSPRSKFGTRKAKHSITIITTTFITFYLGIMFGLLSTNPLLRTYSTLIQIAFAVITTVQGPLLLVYALCSIGSFRIWKMLCCKSRRVTTTDGSIADLPPTTDTSAHSSQAATFTINESSKHKKDSKMIPTNTNPAYASVMLRRNKEFTMTKNDLYGNFSQTRQT